MKTLRRALLLVLGNLAVLLLLAVLLEGAVSLLLFVRDTYKNRPVAERLHTVHDAELGWVNTPGVHRPDMYGPGIALTINAQGFRGTRPTAPNVAPGLLRIICSGDSFTLGYGVSDDESWCHQLGALDPRLETVNMGQGGYGFDQAFLWYRRDGMKLEHQVQVFAFITDDFRRMQRDEFLGYAKPVLELSGDSFRVANVPVPMRGYGLTGWRTRNAELLRSLRTSQLLQRLRVRAGGGDSVAAPAGKGDTAAVMRTRAVVREVLAELKRFHASRGTHLLLVMLPTSYELRGVATNDWPDIVAAEAAAFGIDQLDLFPTFRAIPEAERASLFLTAKAVSYPAAAGHYTRAGNAVVAAEVFAALQTAEIISPGARAAPPIDP